MGLLLSDSTLLADHGKKVLIDPHPAWGSLGVGIAAAAIFILFSAWIIIQRVRHGKDSDDE